MDISYFEARLKRSLQLAKATADICARRSHEGLALLYRKRIKAILAARQGLPGSGVKKPDAATFATGPSSITTSHRGDLVSLTEMPRRQAGDAATFRREL